jgi:hypothetical protein
MRDSLRQSMALSLLVLVALSGSVSPSAFGRSSASVMQDTLPHAPAGVYAKADLETLKKQFAGAQDLRKTLREFYRELLRNPAISGLTIGAHWDHLQPGPNYPDGYDFNFLDDVFKVANKFNKNVQLIITPGFVSPPWLLKELPSCDGLFNRIELVLPNCGKASFSGFPEEQRDDGNTELPLPWNPVYQQAWADFLGHLSDRYSSNPAFFAIAVAGPIGASDEMILPTSDNTPVQPSGFQVDDMWEALIQNSFPVGGTITYPPKSDQAFIDAWKKAIDTYEGTFSGITLVLSPDSGKDLPEFGVNRSNVSPHPDNALLYCKDCSRTPSPLSCEAKTEVIQYFMNATCLTSPNCVNGKATQVGGLTAQINDDPGNIGIGGVKLLTSWSPPLVPAFLGGAEFDHAVSGHQKLRTGCPTYPDKQPCKDLSVEEAAYNVLAVFFNHTPAGSYFKGTMPAISATGNPGGTPMHYLEVPEADVHYANTHQCLSDPSPVLGYMTLQQMLENVKRDFAGIADGTLPITDTTPPVTTPILPAPTGLNGWYSGPTVLNFNALDDLSGVVRTEVSRDNQTTWKQLACDGIALNDDGVHTVFYSSTDLAGNPETAKSITVKIDSIAPVTTVSAKYLGKGPISLAVLFSATDNLSGVARTEYRLDGSPWTTGTSLVISESGLHTILFRSIDVAGNVEKKNSITVNVKLNPPPIQPR